MSHLPDQPYEVPQRSVEHDLDEFRVDTEGRDYIMFIGHASRPFSWATKEEVDAEFEELSRRDKARAELGGFGFGGAHV